MEDPHTHTNQQEVTYARLAALADKKIRAPWPVQALQGFMAGATLCLGAMNANLVEAAVSANPSTSTLGNLIGGAVFPVGLIGIFLKGDNLFTGNCMYVVPALLNGTVPRGRSLAFLGLSFLTNFMGAALITFLLGYASGYFDHDPAKAFVIANAEHKCNLHWGVAVLRGIGANWLVCLGWWQGLSCRYDDTISKIFAVWWPTFTFTAIGFEHSIANMWYVEIGLMVGADATFGTFVGRNLIPVTLGNFLGGALFMGLAKWLAYDANGLKRWSPKVKVEESGRLDQSLVETETVANVNGGGGV